MQIAMVQRWKGIKPGHGKAAVENAMKGYALLDRMATDGRILSYTTYYGMQSSGSFAIVMVDDSRLADLFNDPEWAEYDAEAEMLWEGWESSLFLPAGEEGGISLGRHMEIAASLA